MRVLITGIGGFVGPVVAAAMRRAGHEVHGLVQEASDGSCPGAEPMSLHVADLRVPTEVARVVGIARPDAIVHLAGATFLPEAEAHPHDAYAVNVGGTLAVLAAVRTHVPSARVVYASSADAYGRIGPTELPVTEDVPLRPLSVYGASKAAAEIAVQQWTRAYGLDAIVVRPFNHTGPGQAARFVCAALARQVARAEAGLIEPVLQVGNVDPVRDFSDVRDVAEGYVAAITRGRAGAVYNLCAGVGVSVAEVIAILRTHARIPLRVRSDPSLRRPVEVPRLVGSHGAATKELGWSPRIPLEDTLRDVLDDWRARVVSGD